jgi:hypothetical protein
VPVVSKIDISDLILAGRYGRGVTECYVRRMECKVETGRYGVGGATTYLQCGKGHRSPYDMPVNTQLAEHIDYVLTLLVLRESVLPMMAAQPPWHPPR